MSFKNKLTSGIAATVAIVAFAGLSSAQDTGAAPRGDAQKQEKGDRKFGKRGGFGGMRGGFGRQGGFGLRGIELTDAQKEQIRQIREANKPSEADLAQLKAIRESRRGGTPLTEDQKAQMKALRDARVAKMQSIHQQILSILTPEQRQQLETQKAERQKRMEERRQQRQLRRQQAVPRTDT